MSHPDFIIIGAMKSGTTTLAAQLSEQDGVFVTTPKEPNYFSDDDIYSRGAAWYASLFEDAAPAELKGEASTHYAKLPTYPETISRAKSVLEAPRLVYLIRNPVKRAVSHFIHEWTQGLMTSDMEAEFAAHPELIEYGCYAMQVAPWIEAFGADAVYLTSLEALQADGPRVLAEVAAHIGHEGAVTWVEERSRENVSAERIRKLPFHGLLVDSAPAIFLRRNLVPQFVRDWIKDRRRMSDRPELHGALREALEAHFAEDHAELTRLFPGNRDIAPAYPFLSES